MKALHYWPFARGITGNGQHLPMSWRIYVSGDMGGFMGLFLGASVLTLCELFDFLIYNCVRKLRTQRRVSSERTTAWGTCIPTEKWCERYVTENECFLLVHEPGGLLVPFWVAGCPIHFLKARNFFFIKNVWGPCQQDCVLNVWYYMHYGW